MLLLISINFLLIDVNAATNPYKKSSSFGTNCTWYAWEQAYKRAGVALPGWGNANTWINYAKKAGYETGMTPKAKSIVVWQWDKYGHVGYVEKVVGDKIYVWDSNSSCLDENYEPFKSCMDEALMIDQEAQGRCYSQYAKSIACEYSASYWVTPGDLIGYIYLDSVPKTTTKVTTKKTMPSTNTTTTTKAKASNTYLSNIRIDNINFDFDKDTFEYEFVVDYDVASITINAITEDETSIVHGIGTRDLEVGENIIEIMVTAEDESQATYVLKVTRSDKEEIPTTTKIIQKKKNSKLTKKDYIYIAGFISLIIVVCVIVLIIIRRKKTW